MSLTIGILGGVGAIASARFHLDLVKTWAKTHDAQTDNDFPIIRHISRPLGLTEEGLTERENTRLFAHWTLEELQDCDRIAVICNSITPLMLPWRKILTPVGACQHALESVKSAWLLASDSTIRDQIYQCAYPHIEWKVPSFSLTPVIQQAIADGHALDLSMSIPDEDTVVLGCTELSTTSFIHPNVISPTDEMIKILCNTTL